MSKTFYAVQHGDYFASDIGSTRKREAYQTARAFHKEYADEEIRISICTLDDDFCRKEIVLFEGTR